MEKDKKNFWKSGIDMSKLLSSKVYRGKNDLHLSEMDDGNIRFYYRGNSEKDIARETFSGSRVFEKDSFDDITEFVMYQNGLYRASNGMVVRCIQEKTVFVFNSEGDDYRVYKRFDPVNSVPEEDADYLFAAREYFKFHPMEEHRVWTKARENEEWVVTGRYHPPRTAIVRRLKDYPGLFFYSPEHNEWASIYNREIIDASLVGMGVSTETGRYIRKLEDRLIGAGGYHFLNDGEFVEVYRNGEYQENSVLDYDLFEDIIQYGLQDHGIITDPSGSIKIIDVGVPEGITSIGRDFYVVVGPGYFFPVDSDELSPYQQDDGDIVRAVIAFINDHGIGAGKKTSQLEFSHPERILN